MRLPNVIREILALSTFCFAGLVTCLTASHGNQGDSGDYEFVRDTERSVMVVRGDSESMGKLDAMGNFVPDKEWLNKKQGQPGSGLPPFRVINAPAQKGVYEYRSGRLIKGDIDEDGNFIPIVGSRVVDFKEYRYGKDAPKIYNLPGYFVKKSEKKGK